MIVVASNLKFKVPSGEYMDMVAISLRNIYGDEVSVSGYYPEYSIHFSSEILNIDPAGLKYAFLDDVINKYKEVSFGGALYVLDLPTDTCIRFSVCGNCIVGDVCPFPFDPHTLAYKKLLKAAIDDNMINPLSENYFINGDNRVERFDKLYKELHETDCYKNAFQGKSFMEWFNSEYIDCSGERERSSAALPWR